MITYKNSIIDTAGLIFPVPWQLPCSLLLFLSSALFLPLQFNFFIIFNIYLEKASFCVSVFVSLSYFLCLFVCVCIHTHACTQDFFLALYHAVLEIELWLLGAEESTFTH